MYIVRLDHSLHLGDRERGMGLKSFLKRVGDDRNRGDVESQCDYAMKTYKGTTPETEYKIREELKQLKAFNHRNIVKASC